MQILPTKPTRYEKAWQVQITRNQLAVIAYARNPEERESVADSIALVPMAEQNLRLETAALDGLDGDSGAPPVYL